MSLYKFYRAIDGDFEAACRRFYNENMLQKFLIRFLDEPCCAELNDALGRHDRDAAIKAVHTLTGQARSFGFMSIFADVPTSFGNMFILSEESRGFCYSVKLEQNLVKSAEHV